MRLSDELRTHCTHVCNDMMNELQTVIMPDALRETLILRMYPVARQYGFKGGYAIMCHHAGMSNEDIAEFLRKYNIRDDWWWKKFGAQFGGGEVVARIVYPKKQKR